MAVTILLLTVENVYPNVNFILEISKQRQLVLTVLVLVIKISILEKKFIRG